MCRRMRVVAGLATTFASHYTREVSVAEALSLDAIAVYGRQFRRGGRSQSMEQATQYA